MEIYLCHMFVYRAIEKIGLLHVTENEIVNYVAVSIATVAGAVIMAVIMKKVIALVEKRLQRT